MSDKILGLLVVSALGAMLAVSLGVLVLYRIDAAILAMTGG